MILSDREIQAAMRRESIQIAPTPTPKSWSSTAVDLRLDTQIRRWKPQSRAGMRQTVCPASPDFNYTELANEFTEATADIYLSSLVELGLILFLVTFVVNAAARLLVWRVTRQTAGVGMAA